MKKVITIAFLMLLPQITQAQAFPPALQTIVNEVFSNVQGYVEEYGEENNMTYAIGVSNEHLDPSLTRTMIDLALTGHPVVRGWEREGERFLKSIYVSNKYVVTLAYIQSNSVVMIIYVEV